MDICKDLATWSSSQHCLHICYNCRYNHVTTTWQFKWLFQTSSSGYGFSINIFWDTSIEMTKREFTWNKRTIKKKTGKGPPTDRDFNKFLRNGKGWVKTDTYSGWSGLQPVRAPVCRWTDWQMPRPGNEKDPKEQACQRGWKPLRFYICTADTSACPG